METVDKVTLHKRYPHTHICVRGYFILFFGEAVKRLTFYGIDQKVPGSIPAKAILQCGEILSVAVRNVAVRNVAVRNGTQQFFRLGWVLFWIWYGSF